MADYDHGEITHGSLRNRLRPRQMLWRSFGFGFFAHVGWVMAFQDWLGLEAYIEFCRTNWVNLHWIVGATLAAWMIYEHWQQRQMVGK